MTPELIARFRVLAQAAELAFGEGRLKEAKFHWRMAGELIKEAEHGQIEETPSQDKPHQHD